MTTGRQLKIAVILAGNMVFSMGGANAEGEQFDADKVMKKMDEKQRFSYVAVVVEGLAIARYNKDGKQKTGMECTYDWFYEKGTVDMIYAAFDKYPTYPPGVLVDILVKQKCGE